MGREGGGDKKPLGNNHKENYNMQSSRISFILTKEAYRVNRYNQMLVQDLHKKNCENANRLIQFVSPKRRSNLMLNEKMSKEFLYIHIIAYTFPFCLIVGQFLSVFLVYR